MPNYPRILQKIFGSTGGTSEFGQFGSNQASPPGLNTKDLDVIQALSNYDQGWYAATANAGEPPRIEDMNALFLLLTSQMAYALQKGIPEYDADEEYYPDVSFCQDEGMLWVLDSGAASPTTGVKPSTHQDQWNPVSAETVQQTISASGALTLGFSDHKVEVDVSLGNVAISALPVPDFLGQKLHVFATGSGIASIDGGNGVYANGIFITENTGGAHLESVDNGGTLEWRAVNDVTADWVSGNYNIIMSAYGRYRLLYENNLVSVSSVASGNVYSSPSTALNYPVPFATAPDTSGVSVRSTTSGNVWGGLFSGYLTTGASIRLFGSASDGGGILMATIEGEY